MSQGHHVLKMHLADVVRKTHKHNREFDAVAVAKEVRQRTLSSYAYT
jgi:hypothetical protein